MFPCFPDGSAIVLSSTEAPGAFAQAAAWCHYSQAIPRWPLPLPVTACCPLRGLPSQLIHRAPWASIHVIDKSTGQSQVWDRGWGWVGRSLAGSTRVLGSPRLPFQPPCHHPGIWPTTLLLLQDVLRDFLKGLSESQAHDFFIYPFQSIPSNDDDNKLPVTELLLCQVTLPPGTH